MIDCGESWACPECLLPYVYVRTKKGFFGLGAAYEWRPSLGCKCAENGAFAIWKKDGAGVARGQVLAAVHWCEVAVDALADLECRPPPLTELDKSVLDGANQALVDAIFHASSVAIALRCECRKCVGKGDAERIPGLPIADAVNRDVLDVVAGERAVINQAIAGAEQDVREAIDAGDSTTAHAALDRMRTLILSHNALDAQVLARLGGPTV